MSVVTNIIVTTAISETGIDAINRHLTAEDVGQLVDVTQHGGGRKHVEARVYLGAFNFLNAEAFIAAVRSARWTYPESVRVFVKHQEDDAFESWPWRY